MFIKNRYAPISNKRTKILMFFLTFEKNVNNFSYTENFGTRKFG
jgi:hypothetical protein